MSYLKHICSLSLFCFISFTGFSQTVQSTQIDSLVAKTLGLNNTVGMAIAIVKDGNVVHSKGYGLKSIETKEDVDEHTLFSIASNSKAFTGAALAILVDEGKLSWDDKVVDYIPEFKMYNDYVTANFTITDLLTHRSGLGLGAGDLMIFPDGGDYTIDDIIKSFQYQTPTSAFRTKYDYDNLLYLVAGEVVYRVSGTSWADFIQTRIFDPLAMTTAKPLLNRIPAQANVAMPHSSYNNEIKVLEPYDGGDLVGAAGGINASVNDLTKWMLVQLNKGKYGDSLSKTLFSETVQKQMWSPITMTGYNMYGDGRRDNHFSAYGLGWKISDVKGKIMLSHTGGITGMLSRTMLIPELNLGIVVLTNTDPGSYAFYSVSETLLDMYLGLDKKDWVTELHAYSKAQEQDGDKVTKAVWDTVKANKKTKIDFKTYTGTYNDPWFGDITVTEKNGALWFTCKRSPKLNGQMYFYKATTFAVKWEFTGMPCDAFATFHLNEEGQAIGIKMKGISPNIDFSFDFQDLNLTRVD
ncbi:serine hydrolase [Formosa sediminum]|uniref:Serine hydrolase n=1 Tax=Formosa sediminum TaxID=2594004 RepID=A0A516GT61_9FLAO|nr:serine hydrolase [Formosa sediminum]QDO94707.1 serine hydrolase [Formosa sediminum]